MKVRGFVMAILLLSFSVASVGAQQKTVPLVDYIRQLEQRFGLHFSFIDSDIEGIQVVPQQQGQNSAAIIAYLETASGLLFSAVADGYVVIHRPDRSKQLSCAFVYDAATHQPIANVSILSESGQHSVTDESGYFSITAFPGAQLSISHVGYKKRIAAAAHDGIKNCPILLLEKQITELENVSVSHFLTKGLQVKADRSYLMHPRQTGLLPGLGEPDVLQTLQQLPGIISIDQSVSNISVRSGSHDQNLFLWNGIRLFQTGHFFGLISAFNPNLPHAVSIYKNGTPAAFGESVSGTILIDSEPDLELSQTAVGLNLVNVYFNTSFRSSAKTAWQFSGRRSLTDIFDSPVYQKYRERVFQNTKVTNFFADQQLDYNSEERFNFYDFTAQVKHALSDRSTIRANAILIANNLEVQQRSSLDSIAETSELRQMSFAGNLRYETVWSAAHKTDVQIAISKYSLLSHDFYVDDDQVDNQKNEVLDHTFAIGHHIALGARWNMHAHYSLTDLRVTNDGYATKSAQQQSLAVQVDGAYKNIYLSAGLRNLHLFSYRRFRMEPRMALSYRLQTAWTLTLAGEAKSQTAYQEIERQQDFFGIETRRWKLADDTLTPLLTSNQLSAAVQYQADGWLITGEAFLKKVHDIASGSQGFQNQFSSAAAIGDYTVKGIELLAQKKLGYFTGWVNFHLNDSKYYFQQLDPQVFANSYETPQAFRWGLIYGGKRWEAAVGGTWSAGRYYTQPNSRIPSIAEDGSLLINYASPNSSRLDNNMLLNASCSVLLPLGKRIRFKTGLAFQNVLDDSSVINRTYRINQINETIEEIDNYNLARTSNLFIRVYF